MTPAIDYLQRTLADANVVELRHNTGPGEWHPGLFDQIDPLRAALRSLAGEGNLYISLNRPNVTATNAMGARFLKDEDISHIIRIPVDFDPVRPAGCMATDAKLQAALRTRDRFVSAMRALGWPMPALGMSGSGGHAIYRCLVPASVELREMLASIYEAWHADFSDELVTFDQKVRNPSRIFRLYGTINRKGENTPERPYRRAEVVLPVQWQAVSRRQIENLAQRSAKRPTPVSPPRQRPALGGLRGDLATLDAPAWFSSHGAYKRQLGGGKHAVTCPWNDEHSYPDHPRTSDTVLLPPTGRAWWTFFCSHAHCEGRSLLDVVALWRDSEQFCAAYA